MPGVEVVIGRDRCDFYTGTKDALIAAGWASAEMFPGEPGRAITAVPYRPAGVERNPGEQSWFHLPGYMQITRCFGRRDGLYIIRLTVSLAEQEWRAAARERQWNAAVERGPQKLIDHVKRSTHKRAPHPHLVLVKG